jgi:exopolysaccharide production protein ExoY
MPEPNVRTEEYYSSEQYVETGMLYTNFKRLMDLIGAFFGILILLILVIFFAPFYVTGKNKGNMFFKQTRIGKNGKEFNIYKFRSMVKDADILLKQNKELYAKYIRNNYKLEPHEDPRITKFGQFLRKSSLDEFPQFINVLKGEMSLVGPRPVVKVELQEYGHKKNDFLSVKPGVTGYWQASGRSSVGYPERVDLELFYVYNQSTLFDFKIIIKTIVSVLQKRGAY